MSAWFQYNILSFFNQLLQGISAITGYHSIIFSIMTALMYLTPFFIHVSTKLYTFSMPTRFKTILQHQTIKIAPIWIRVYKISYLFINKCIHKYICMYVCINTHFYWYRLEYIHIYTNIYGCMRTLMYI